MEEEAAKRIIELLQSGAVDLVQVMAEPQPLIGILNIAHIVLGLTLIPYLLAKKVYPKFKQRILNTGLIEADEDEASFYAAVTVAIMWILITLFMATISDTIIRIMYPEYWGIKEILQAIGSR